MGVGAQSSIEVCLTNVRDSDIFVLVLSQRYGPIVPGYDKSATHLEYATAMEAKKRMVIFVRDRLFSEFEAYQKDPTNYKPSPWLKGEKNFKELLGFVGEVKKLRKPDAANWVWTFDNSRSVKRRLDVELSTEKGAAILQSLQDRNALPIAFLETKLPLRNKTKKAIGLPLCVQNAGASALINPKVEITLNKKSSTHSFSEALRPGEKTVESANISISDIVSADTEAEVTITYSTVEGYALRDIGVLQLYFDDMSSENSHGKMYYRFLRKEMLPPDQKV